MKCSWVSGTVLYDGGNLFRLTTQMQDMAFGAQVGVNPADADELGLTEGAPVTVRNEHGELTLSAKLDPASPARHRLDSRKLLPVRRWVRCSTAVKSPRRR